VDDCPTPQTKTIMGEDALRLLQAIDALPPDQAKAVELRYLKQLTLAEIAKQMDRTVGSVAGLIRRGFDMLAETLPKEIVRK